MALSLAAVCVVGPLIRPASAGVSQQAAPASGGTATGDSGQGFVAADELYSVAAGYLDAWVKRGYSSMYDLVDADCPGRKTFEGFVTGHERFRQLCGDYVGFSLQRAAVTSYLTLVIDCPPNSPATSEGPSTARWPTDWRLEKADWRLLSAPWEYLIRQAAAGNEIVPDLQAVAKRDGTLWSARAQPVCECADAEGLEKSLQLLAGYLIAGDRAGIYGMLAGDARSRLSWGEFERGMIRLQQHWLKPVRVFSISAPEVWIDVTLQLKPTAEFRRRLEQHRGHELAETLDRSFGLQMRRRNGQWRIWLR